MFEKAHCFRCDISLPLYIDQYSYPNECHHIPYTDSFIMSFCITGKFSSLFSLLQIQMYTRPFPIPFHNYAFPIMLGLSPSVVDTYIQKNFRCVPVYHSEIMISHPMRSILSAQNAVFLNFIKVRCASVL